MSYNLILIRNSDKLNYLFIPKNSDTKQNKGSILKASVDYIIYAQNEIKELERLREQNKRLIQRLKVRISRIFNYPRT